MRRFIVLLLITGTVWAQTGLDKLVLKDGTEFLGECAGVTENVVYFKSTGELAYQVISISRIQSLQLKNGKTIIRVRDNYIKKWTILDYKPLSIKDKATYDAKKDARRWLVFSPLALISSGGLGTATFFISDDDDYFDTEEEIISLISAFIVGSLGLVGSHYLFSIEDIKNIEGTSAENEDIKNIEGTSAENIELYKKMYYKQFKKQKLKNIMISAVATALIAGAVTIHVLSNLSLDFGPNPNLPF